MESLGTEWFLLFMICSGSQVCAEQGSGTSVHLWVCCSQQRLTTIIIAGFIRVLKSNRTDRMNLSMCIERGFIRMTYRLQSSESNNGWS